MLTNYQIAAVLELERQRRNLFTRRYCREFTSFSSIVQRTKFNDQIIHCQKLGIPHEVLNLVVYGDWPGLSVVMEQVKASSVPVEFTAEYGAFYPLGMAVAS